MESVPPGRLGAGAPDPAAPADRDARAALLRTALDRTTVSESLEVRYEPQVRVCDSSVSGFFTHIALRGAGPRGGDLVVDGEAAFGLPSVAANALTDAVLARTVDDLPLLQALGQRAVAIEVHLPPRRLCDATLRAHFLQRYETAVHLFTVEATGLPSRNWSSDDSEILGSLTLVGFGLLATGDREPVARPDVVLRRLRGQITIPGDSIRACRNYAPAAAAVRASVGLGSRLGLRVVGHGVEDWQQWYRAEELGVAYLQGPLVGPAMSPAELADWSRDWQQGSNARRANAPRRAPSAAPQPGHEFVRRLLDRAQRASGRPPGCPCSPDMRPPL